MKNNFGLTLIFTFSIFFVLVSQVAITNMPYNPLRQGKVEASIAALAPQGWAFFTRSPREPQIYLYKEEGGKLLQDSYKNASMESGFGFTRKVRAKGIELGHIYERAQKLSWVECEDDLNLCHRWDTMSAKEIINPAYAPTICGELYLVQKPIIPWAWASSIREVHMPSKTIKLNALCINQKQ